MQIRVLPSLMIFIGSYLPLALILLVQDVDYQLIGNGLCWQLLGQQSSCVIPLGHPKMSAAILAICLFSFCLTLVALSKASPKVPIKIKEVRYIPAELMTYTLPYVVSFMSVGYQDTGKFSGLIVFLGWMFWITYKSGQIFLNPMLTVFGWRLYEVTYTFLGDTPIHSGRALARGSIENERSYPHTVVQDVIVLGSNELRKDVIHGST